MRSLTECAYVHFKVFLLMPVLVFLNSMKAIRAISSISCTEHHGRRMHGVEHYKIMSEATTVGKNRIARLLA